MANEHRIIIESNGTLTVPDSPQIPFIEGDGIGPDIWRATRMVIDSAVQQAYDGRRKISWLEVLAGEKGFEKTGNWLPDETLADIEKHVVAIKGPLTTPVGEGIRSINVAIRQKLDLYACVRPVKYIESVPSPMKHPEKINMVVFRENTEDLYAGIEFQAGSADADTVRSFFKRTNGDVIVQRHRDRHQTHQPNQDQTAGRKSHSLCPGERLFQRYPDAQRQHHEIY